MSNVAGKAYAINAISPMRRYLTWLNEFSFMFARSKPSTLASLLGLSFIHFARWVIVRRDDWTDLGQGKQKLTNDYLLFCSNFNGTWDQYIDAFADGFPSGLDFFWTTSTKYPQSVPITPFKNYIRVNQADTDYYYNATPGAAQWDIKAALRVRRELLRLAAESRELSPADFRKSYVVRLLKIQHDLGSQGYAPVASNDTFIAERRRNVR
jgi:hypothetical protein